MAYHYSYAYGYPPAPYAPQQPVGYSDGGYRAECQHCHKLGHPSDKCWLLDQNAHRRPSHWRQPRDGPSQGQSSSAGGAGYSGMDLDQSTASKMAAMREVRDRIDSSNSSRRSRSPQGARSPRSPHGGARSPTHPHASRFDAGPSSSFSSSSRRPDPRANGAGPSRDSGWNTAASRKPANANEESRSPRHTTANTTNATDPRLRGGRKRTVEEGEITSPTKTGGSNSGERTNERSAGAHLPPPGLPPRPPTNVTTQDISRVSPRNDDDDEDAPLQQQLFNQFEVVEKRTIDLTAHSESPWAQQPHSRKQNAAVMLKSTRRYIQLQDEQDRKQAELDDAEEWVKNNKDEDNMKEIVAAFEKDVRAQMRKDLDETRAEKDKAYEEFAENLSQVTDYHWLIDICDKKVARRIISLAKPMQQEYRLAFRKLRADFQDIERASRDGSQTFLGQAAPVLQPTKGAVQEPAATASAAAASAPPPAASSSSLVAVPSTSSIDPPAAPATASTSAAPASTPAADATADHVRRLSKAITAIRRRLDHLEENTSEAVEDTHAMQGEMSDNLRWMIREAIKEEKAQHKAKKRKIDEANEDDDDAAAAGNEAGGQAAPAASGSGAGSVAAPRDPQAMDVSSGEINGASAPISSSTTASAPAEPAVQPDIDLDALTEALLARVRAHNQPIMDNFRLEAEQIADQKVDDKSKLLENRVQDAFKAVEGEFSKMRSEQERRFDFITQEMERRENEYKARIAEFEEKQRESAETIAKLSSHAEMVDKVFGLWTPIIRFAHNAMQASASRPNTPAQPQQQQMPGPSQVRPLQQVASPTMPSHPSNGSEHGRSNSISADAQFNGQARRPPAQVSQQQQQQIWPQQGVDAHQAEMTRRLLQAQSQTQNQNQLQNHQPAAQPQSAPQPPVRPAQTQARPHLPEADPNNVLLEMFTAFFKRRTISFAGIEEPLRGKMIAQARQVIHTNAACLNMGGMTPTIRQGMLSAAEAVITAAGQTPGVRPSHTVAARFISDAATAQQVQQRQNVPVAAQPSPPPAPSREPSPLGFEIVGQNSRAVKGEPAAAVAAEEEVAAGAGGSAAAMTNGSGSGSGGAGHGEEVSGGASNQPNKPQDDSTSAQANKQKEQGATQEQDKVNHDDEGDEDGVTTPPPPSAVLPVDNNN